MFLSAQMNFVNGFMTSKMSGYNDVNAKTVTNGLALLSTQRTMHFGSILL
jgi:hypothetical protein